MQVQVKPKASSTGDSSAAVGKISASMIEERDKKLATISGLIAEKMKRNGKKLMNFLDDWKEEPDVVSRFLRKLKLK